MSRLLGVKFDKSEPIEYYVSGPYEPLMGDKVIAETDMGLDVGTVVMNDCNAEALGLTPPIKAVLRIVTPEDMERIRVNEEKERQAFDLCREKIEVHKLPMKLIRVKCIFDNKKMIFYFFSKNRVDFRNLVKDLAAVFKTRIELRQVGVRDEARMVGAIGSCGRTLCCSSGISDFEPVSIKMAKDQNLSLNPTSISGICGRLMCCLAYENETYEYLHKTMPSVGDFVVSKSNSSEKGNVVSVDILSQRVKVLVTENGDDKNIKELMAEDLVVRSSRRSCPRGSRRCKDEKRTENSSEMADILENE